MKITALLTDEAVLQQIGQRISMRRVELNLTQAALAKKAGVSKRTVERIEDGASAQMLSMIKVFRVLELMDRLDSMLPEPQPKPMDLLKQKGKVRVRASAKQPVPGSSPGWTWKEDE